IDRNVPLRDVKRAEARLSLGLRSLEEARLYYLNTMTREQQRLQQELLRLQKSEVSPYHACATSHTCPISLTAFSPTPSLLEVFFPPPNHQLFQLSAVPGIPLAVFLGPREASWEQKRPQEASLRPSKPKNGVWGVLHVPSVFCLLELQGSLLGKGKDSVKEEPRDSQAKDAMTITKPMNLPENQRFSLDRERLIMDPEAYAADGRLRTMYNRPDFLKSYGEVRKARYIRHKGIPAWEKELSLQDIFGHKKTIGHASQEMAAETRSFSYLQQES
uniref:Uncharacterized protein n=1 Tax=Pseudonaja textilis TaxID=8673 RepID=A0A670Y2C4_PSETE